MQRRRWTTRVIIVLLVVVAVWVLFTVVFPWVDRQLNDPVLSSAGSDTPVATREHLRCRSCWLARDGWTDARVSRRMQPLMIAR